MANVQLDINGDLDFSTDNLVIALKGADDEIREKIFKNMSKRAAELMRDDLEAMGPVKLSDVESAQKEILIPMAGNLLELESYLM